MRTVDHRVVLAVPALHVLHDERTTAVHDDQRAAARVDNLQALEPDGADMLRLERRLLGHAGRRAPDVERPHGQLGAGFADRLGGNHARGQATLDETTGREIAPVALRAHATA